MTYKLTYERSYSDGYLWTKKELLYSDNKYDQMKEMIKALKSAPNQIKNVKYVKIITKLKKKIK